MRHWKAHLIGIMIGLAIFATAIWGWPVITGLFHFTWYW